MCVDYCFERPPTLAGYQHVPLLSLWRRSRRRQILRSIKRAFKCSLRRAFCYCRERASRPAERQVLTPLPRRSLPTSTRSDAAAAAAALHIYAPAGSLSAAVSASSFSALVLLSHIQHVCERTANCWHFCGRDVQQSVVTSWIREHAFAWRRHVCCCWFWWRHRCVVLRTTASAKDLRRTVSQCVIDWYSRQYRLFHVRIASAAVSIRSMQSPPKAIWPMRHLPLIVYGPQPGTSRNYRMVDTGPVCRTVSKYVSK